MNLVGSCMTPPLASTRPGLFLAHCEVVPPGAPGRTGQSKRGASNQAVDRDMTPRRMCASIIPLCDLSHAILGRFRRLARACDTWPFLDFGATDEAPDTEVVKPRTSTTKFRRSNVWFRRMATVSGGGLPAPTRGMPAQKQMPSMATDALTFSVGLSVLGKPHSAGPRRAPASKRT